MVGRASSGGALAICRGLEVTVELNEKSYVGIGLYLFACVLERESILKAWRIIPMRLIYRPLLSYVIWKAILRAIKGDPEGLRKALAAA